MATTIKISALTSLGSMTDSSIIPISSSGSTYKLSGTVLTTYMLNKISVNTLTASGSGSLSFDSGTGVITFTPAASVSNLVSGSYTVSLASGGQVSWSQNGLGDPTLGALSSGAKVVLYPLSSSAGYTDYAMGINANNLWSSVPQNVNTNYFSWYGGATQILKLDGTGVLTLTNNIKFSDGSTQTKSARTSVSVSTASASGSGSLSYDNTTGIFTFTPPALSSYITSVNWASPGTIGSSTPNSGVFTTLSSSGNTSFSGNNVSISIQPTGTGVVYINPTTTGAIDNMTVGASTPKSGAFTTLSANTTTTSGAISVTYTPSTTSGAAIQSTGKDSQGGTGYFDFFKATNTTSGVTNANKSFRLNSTGSFEIVNSAYTTTILQLTDAGKLSITGDIDSSGSTVNLLNSPTTLNIANGTSSGTVNLGSGITASGNTINVNLGTNGASGSTTNISLGSSTSGSTSSTTIYGSVTVKDVRDTIYTGGSTTGTITPDCANGDIQTITLTGAITFNAFANPVNGQTMTMVITQPASGGTYTLTSTMKFAGGYKTLSTGNGNIDILTVSYIGGTYYASLVTGYA